MTRRPPSLYSCLGKVAFDTPSVALAVNRRRTREGKRNQPYRCTLCGKWHLGRRNPRGEQ